MTVTLVLVIAMAVLFSCGVYLLLERSLTRMLLGFLLLGNALNLLLLTMSGAAGDPPIGESADGIADPLPQAFALTAIVITFAVSAFLLALIHRSWRLSRADEVEVDEADVAIRQDRQDPADDDPELAEEDDAAPRDPKAPEDEDDPHVSAPHDTDREQAHP
ncbi:Na(+)/H(+) antiporter subunit C [Curtobacterium sp. MCJR17_055]|uniref:Na(+)/H(+) antiporter subunit C n=1 Tax=unclassified Curtobacterium TaxID=257496 RepID=UPI000D8CC96F|nr:MULTISPECIES: Na(+)/H(+) antiporter subunit C [unclassified Curtobacterium]PYY38074.1 Na(+)/H(+) antiporter subunit C [Curtobacterium sp. MCBD17_029]PYY57099.1 Na(+)/H(+) antiporter subunit C [Curtobacterium sp. MCJR17_055]PYY61985.1 Na(+)/H(+) antiporter subunit C [Curtobacterium sp. MCPF17_015]